ncbi:MAG: iron-containing alcohol dehydrogenase [Sedimentisphaerales bacterium]|jgi:alcohol dehydrogenase class IV|nr:iron-containing alcohol dehydrogenase [Sedimentisphaerales bacterium]
MMDFEFATATRILFGPGTVKKVAPAVARMGRRVLIVTGRSPGRAQGLIDDLDALGLVHRTFQATSEPTVQMASEAISLARDQGVEVVVGIGGGSAIDLAKVSAAMLGNQGDLLDYLEVVGRGKVIERPSVPWVAVPTTAGTGAEVTSNAVLLVPDHGRKVSIRSPLMLARLAVVDPELTMSLPASVTAYTGLDALTQLIEAFVSTGANPITDGLCQQGLAVLSRSIRTAYRSGQDIAARTDMALASLLSGMALSNAGLGLVHGIAGPLGGMIRAPHGAICGRLLPYVMEANILALARTGSNQQALQKYQQIARLLTGKAEAEIGDSVRAVAAICQDLDIPGLAHWGLTPSSIPPIAKLSLESSSTKSNCVQLDIGQVTELVHKAL